MSEYGRQSLWRDMKSVDAARARDLAGRLELRAKAKDEVEARETYLSLLGITAGERVLDVGCGSGVVTREIAKRVGAHGFAVGLDLSPALLAVAREFAREADMGDRIEFREGSALNLPFSDNSFDAVLCATVLSHVAGGETAIAELARVVRPAGRVGVFEIDTDMTAFSHPDRVLTRRIIAAASDATAVDGWLGRRMPSLFVQAGLKDVRARAFFPIETDPHSFYVGFALRCAETALQAGAITDAEHSNWLDAFGAEQARGPVIAGRLHIFIWGSKAD